MLCGFDPRLAHHFDFSGFSLSMFDKFSEKNFLKFFKENELLNIYYHCNNKRSIS